MDQHSIGIASRGGPAAPAGLWVRLLALLLLASPAFPADRIFDARGFIPEREFLSELPYEHVDPMTGNLLLTFTDLVLPGNAGFDLRVQRTYNSKIYENYTTGGPVGFREDSWAGIGWSLHLGRVSTFPGLPTLPGPVIEMPDGSQHQAYRHKDGGWGHYITRDYWTYEDRNPSPILRLPSGITYTFGRRESGPRPTEVTYYVTEIRDPFDNTITVNYAPPPAPEDVIASVVQKVGTKTRTITFAYDPTLQGRATGSLRSMTFDGRTWNYRQKRTRDFGYTVLTEVQPPVGPSWLFEYSESPADNVSPWLLTGLVTPSRGRIDYSYAPQLFRISSGAIYTPSLKTRTASGPGIAAGTWRYEYRSPDWRDPIESSVTSPCGTTVRYTFKPIGSYGTEEPWAIGSMISKETLEGQQVLEQQVLTWVRSVPISDFPESGNSFATHVPLLGTRTVTLAGSPTVYRTRHFYNTAPYARSSASNFNDHGRPYLTLEDGELTRSTTREFAYPPGSDPSFGSRYIVDRLGSETLVSGTDVFTQSFEYTAATGFKTSENRYGIVTSFTPDASGNVATVRDANGNVTSFSYDWGVVKNTTTPEFTITREINTDGSVRTETRRGFTTRFQYDALGRPTLVTPPIGLETRTDYDNFAGSYTRVSRGSSAAITKLNGFEQVVGTENSLRLATTRRYDTCGRPVYQGYPFYAGGGGSPSVDTGTTTVFDGLGRVVRRTHPDGTFQRFEHHGIDVTITDEITHQTVQDRSAFGSPEDARLVAVTDADAHTTRYSYNGLGRLTRVEGPGGTAVRRFVYNTRNELVTETHPENGTLTFTYDAAGNLKTRRDAEFGLTTYGYDRNNRLVSIDRPGTTYDTSIDWDASDNRTLVANGYVNSQFQYDTLNRLFRRTDKIGARSLVATYTYDDSFASNGNLKTLGYPTGRSVIYDYDSEGRITAVKSAGKPLADTFRYHASGGIASFRRGNGIVENVAYDARYRPVEIDSGNVLDLRYGYDNVGNVRSVDDSRAGMDLSFSYDALDRVLTANGPWGAGRFSYDALGNRLSRSVGPASTTYTYDAATQRLASATGTDAGSFGYDRNGNLRQDSHGTYTHAPTNLMETATVSGAVSTYRYDGDDMRKVRTSAGETHYYVHGPGGGLLSELLEKGSFVEPVRDYVYAGSRLIAAIKPSPLVVTPTSLAFTALAGGPAVPGLKVKVETLGASGIAFSAAPSAAWISVSATSGATPYNLMVAVNPASLTTGTYTGTVTVVAPLAQGSPKVVSVTVVVVAQPELQVTPGSLTFEASAPSPAASLAPFDRGPAAARAADAVLGMPLVFERNQGQADASVQFLSRGPGYGLFLTPEAVVVGLVPSPQATEQVRMRFLDASPTPTLVAHDERPGRSHYYRGNDPTRWLTGVPQFGRVAYEQVYPGIDAVFYGNQRQLEYDLVVAPGADPGRVRLSFEGADGIRLNDDGDLLLEVANGELVQKKPIVYQEADGGRRAIAGRYRVTGETTVAFDVGDYDRDQPLMIDPVLSYFTYLGGSVGGDPQRPGEDRLYAVAIDASGSTYVSGSTLSTDFPLAGGGEATVPAGGFDIFVAKLDPLGASLRFSTYLGGSMNDWGGFVAVGPGGSVFLAAGTRSPDFPTTPDAPQRFFAGPFTAEPDVEGHDVVVAKLGPDGELLFSTYFGGRGNEWATGLGVDSSGAAYVGGTTWSDNLPVKNALQAALAGSDDAFLAKFVPSGDPIRSSLAWATYLGGSQLDIVNAFTTDTLGNSYLTGYTQSPDFPTTVAPLQGALNRGAPVPPLPQYPHADAFVTKVDPTGTSILYSTYLGGTDEDWGTGIALGPGNAIYVTGATYSADFPLQHPLQPYLHRGYYEGYGTAYDGFASVLVPDGSALVYSTFLGTTYPSSPRVDSSGSLFFLYGSGDGLAVHPFHTGGGTSLARIAPDGSAYLYASPLADGDGVGAGAFTLDSRGNAFLVGETATPDLATPGAFQTGLRGWSDGFVMKLTGTGGPGGGSSFLQQALLIKDRTLATGPSWTAFENLPWLELSKTSGTGPAVVFANVDTTGLLPGVYEGAIRVSAPGALGSPKAVPVKLTITPSAPQPPQANAGGPYFGQLFPEIELEGSGLDPAGSIAFYLWSFDDGATALGPRVKHLYATPGSHSVTLKIRGFSGAEATATASVYINYPAELRPGGPYTGVVDQTIPFDASASFDPDGTIVSYQWSFGDGATGIGPVFPHRYSHPGTYVVTLSAQDNTGYWSAVTTTATITVPVNEPPIARPGGPYLGEPGVVVTFDGRASTDSDGSIATWAWDFGDGSTGTGAVSGRTYEAAGEYDVTLTVTDNLGAQNTAATHVSVGVFGVTPDRLRFRMFAGGSNPAAQSLSLAFPLPHDWTATASEPWLSLGAASGTTPSTLAVSVNGSSLDPGTHPGTVTITPAGVGGRPVLVGIELVVEPPAGTCDAAAWFCEPFDELLLGNLAGQHGWEATPEATTSNSVVADARPGPGAKVLRLDPAAGLVGIERVDFTERSLDGVELSLEVMSEGVDAAEWPATVDLLGPVGTGGWGVENRAFGSLLIGSSLHFRDNAFTDQTLLDTMEPGRWYTVRLVYRGGVVEAWVDGVREFVGAMNDAAAAIAGLAVTGAEAAGSVSLDLLQVKPYVPPPLEGELVVEPGELTFTYDADRGTVSRAQPPVAPEAPVRMASAGSAVAPTRAAAARPAKALPLEFEANLGQADPSVRFLARGRGYGLFVTPAETVVALPGTATPVRVRFEGARRDAELRGLDERPGKSHYLVGRDPARWHRNVPHYARVEARELYPGVSAVFYGSEGKLEYDLELAAGVDPGVVGLAFEGVESLRVDEQGDLVLRTPASELRHQKPLVYQVVNGERRLIAASYTLTGARRAAFRLGSFDASLPLTIDPALVYSTFLGGTFEDGAHALAIDLAGHAYVGGYTASFDFPVAGAYQDVSGGNFDAFVTKLDLAGTGIVYSTYIGGVDADFIDALAVDPEGNVFAGGRTASTDFPLANPYQATPGGNTDGFLLELDPSGTSLVFSTYLGGWLGDTVTAVAVGPDGYVSVTGQATSGFPQLGPQYWGWNALTAAFAARFSPTGVPVFCSGLGGGTWTQGVYDYNAGHGVAVDGAGNTWVTGWTSSYYFPVVGSALQTWQAGQGDAFVSEFSASGELIYSSYLGGSNSDQGNAIAVDASGSVVVTGATYSADFPLRNPVRSFHGGAGEANRSDVFITKLDPSDASPAFSTFLGEPHLAWGAAIAVDATGSIHVGGRTDLTAEWEGDTQAFVTSLSPNGSSIDFSTRLGGPGFDEITALAVDATGDLWAAGRTNSVTEFPAIGAYQSLPGGDYDAFLVRYSNGPANPAGILHLASGYGVDESAGSATVTVGRIGGRSGEVSVDYATSDGTAVTPWDYSPVSGTLVFSDGATTATFTVPVFHNEVHLGDKAFSVTLNNPTGAATLGRSSAPVIIVEADPHNTGFSARFRIRDRSRPTGPGWTASVDVPWLTLSAYSGTGPSVVTATVSVAGLREDTYNGSITINANALGSPLVVPVTLTIVCSENCPY